jgi:hypothetical protein
MQAKFTIFVFSPVQMELFTSLFYVSVINYKKHSCIDTIVISCMIQKMALGPQMREICLISSPETDMNIASTSDTSIDRQTNCSQMKVLGLGKTAFHGNASNRTRSSKEALGNNARRIKYSTKMFTYV